MNFSKYYNQCLFLLLIGFSFQPNRLSATGELGKEIVPNPDLLSRIENLIRPSPEEQEAYHKLSSEAQTNVLKAKFAGLESAVGGNRRELVLQLFYFSRLAATNAEQGFAELWLREVLKISDDDVTAAMLPLLDSRDANTRKQAGNVLLGIDLIGPSGKPDDVPRFQRYEGMLRTNKEVMPKGLVRYMFNTHPKAAVKLMARVYGGPDSENEVATKLQMDRNSALKYFTNRPEWWAQLYAATAIYDDRIRIQPLMLSELLDVLKTSENSLVFEKLEQISADSRLNQRTGSDTKN